MSAERDWLERAWLFELARLRAAGFDDDAVMAVIMSLQQRTVAAIRRKKLQAQLSDLRECLAACRKGQVH